MCYSEKRGEVYVGNEDGTITIWDVRKGQIIFVLKGHDDGIRKLFWIEQEECLVSGSKDKCIKKWQIPKVWRDKKLIQDEIEQALIEEKTRNIIKMQQEMKDEEDELSKWNQD